MMNGPEKSDPAIVAMKPTNKAGQPAAERSAAEPNAAEPGERRAGTKGNADQQSTHRTQSRASASQALERIRKVATERKKERFTHALPPHRHRSPGGGVLRTCAERSQRRGSDDLEGLRGRHRAQARGFARPGPTRSVSESNCRIVARDKVAGLDPALTPHPWRKQNGARAQGPRPCVSALLLFASPN
jgi:RNA-directed DNA polymerase